MVTTFDQWSRKGNEVHSVEVWDGEQGEVKKARSGKRRQIWSRKEKVEVRGKEN